MNTEKKYKEISFDGGINIETALEELKSHKELVCGLFNGQMLFSDIDDIDSAYIKIVGKTKAEFKEEERKWHEAYQEKKRKHEESIPQLTKEWIEKGSVILDEKYREEWNKCVPIRLQDMYEGMELKACLNIIVELNNGCTMADAKKIIEGQGHSGMSFGLVRSLVKSFCDRGNEFFNYVSN